MSDELPIVEDHPRADELQQIWNQLSLRRPEGVEALGELDIIDHEFPLPLCFFDEAHVPVRFLEERPADEVAFGLAYSKCLDPMSRFLEDSVGVIEVDPALLLESPLGIPLAPILGIAGGLTGVWRAVTRFAEREREAIEVAVDWVHAAGFDPNAGVKMFMSLSGWFAEHANNEEVVEPSVLKKFGAMTIMAPIVGAMSVPISKDPPMVAAADRAAAVRTAVVARGLHRR